MKTWKLTVSQENHDSASIIFLSSDQCDWFYVWNLVRSELRQASLCGGIAIEAVRSVVLECLE